MAMDPTIKALAAIKREVRKIVSSATTTEDKLAVIDFGERELAQLRKEIVVDDRPLFDAPPPNLSDAERRGFGDVGKL